MNVCNTIVNTGDYDKPFKGSIQLSSNQKTNLFDPNSSFSVNVLNGVNGGTLVLDSIILENDIANINGNNSSYLLNAVAQSFPLGEYQGMLNFVNMLAASLSAAAGHLISVVFTANFQIEFIGTLGFTDTIVLHQSIARMLGFRTDPGSTTVTLVLVDANRVVSNSVVTDPPTYSRWANVNIYATYEDISYTYGKNSYNILSCVALGLYGDHINHREVEYRPLKMKNYLSGINIQVLDEYQLLLPLGQNSLTITFFYK